MLQRCTSMPTSSSADSTGLQSLSAIITSALAPMKPRFFYIEFHDCRLAPAHLRSSSHWPESFACACRERDASMTNRADGPQSALEFRLPIWAKAQQNRSSLVRFERGLRLRDLPRRRGPTPAGLDNRASGRSSMLGLARWPSRSPDEALISRFTPVPALGHLRPFLSVSAAYAWNCDRKTSPLSSPSKFDRLRRSMTGPLTSER